MNPEDYEKLGLGSNATLEEVKHKYDMLMKRSLHDESVETDVITAAYDKIIDENTIDFFNADAELLHARGINKKKLVNFLFQNKIRLIISVWLLVCIGLLLYIFFFQPGNISLMPDMVPF